MVSRHGLGCALLVLATGSLAAACSGGDTGEARTGSPQPEVITVAEAEQSFIEMTGMDLYMYDYAETGTGLRNPNLWVHAAESSLAEDKTWTLKDAHAVVYRDKEEDLLFDAARGHFDEKQGIAWLEGEVKVSAGTLNLELAEIEWVNEESIARSSSVVTLKDEGTVLEASSLNLNPDNGVITLTDVTGRLSLEQRSL